MNLAMGSLSSSRAWLLILAASVMAAAGDVLEAHHSLLSGRYPSHVGGRYLLQDSGKGHASVEPNKPAQTMGAAVSSLQEIIAEQIEREDIEASREARITAIQRAISRSVDDALQTQEIVSESPGESSAAPPERLKAQREKVLTNIMELQAQRDEADSQDIERVVEINERIVDILLGQIPQNSGPSVSLARLDDDSIAALRNEAVALETREVDRLKNLENGLQDTISKLQNVQEEGSTTTAGGPRATETLQNGYAMSDRVETEEDDVLPSLMDAEWRRQIEVTEERAAQRLQDLQEVNNAIIDQLRLLSADNEDMSGEGQALMAISIPSPSEPPPLRQESPVPPISPSLEHRSQEDVAGLLSMASWTPDEQPTRSRRLQAPPPRPVSAEPVDKEEEEEFLRLRIAELQRALQNASLAEPMPPPPSSPPPLPPQTSSFQPERNPSLGREDSNAANERELLVRLLSAVNSGGGSDRQRQNLLRQLEDLESSSPPPSRPSLPPPRRSVPRSNEAAADSSNGQSTAIRDARLTYDQFVGMLEAAGSTESNQAATEDSRQSSRVRDTMALLARLQDVQNRDAAAQDGGNGETASGSGDNLPAFLAMTGIEIRDGEEVPEDLTGPEREMEMAEKALIETRARSLEDRGVIIPDLPPLLAVAGLLGGEAPLADINDEVFELIRAVSSDGGASAEAAMPQGTAAAQAAPRRPPLSAADLTVSYPARSAEEMSQAAAPTGQLGGGGILQPAIPQGFPGGFPGSIGGVRGLPGGLSSGGLPVGFPGQILGGGGAMGFGGPASGFAGAAQGYAGPGAGMPMGGAGMGMGGVGMGMPGMGGFMPGLGAGAQFRGPLG